MHVCGRWPWPGAPVPVEAAPHRLSNPVLRGTDLLIPKPRVLLTNSIDPETAARAGALPRGAGARQQRRHAPAADWRRRGAGGAGAAAADLVRARPRLRAVVRHAVGLDMIPVEAATRRRIPVANLPGSNTQAAAEYCLAAMLHLRRGLATLDARLAPMAGASPGRSPTARRSSVAALSASSASASASAPSAAGWRPGPAPSAWGAGAHAPPAGPATRRGGGRQAELFA